MKPTMDRGAADRLTEMHNTVDDIRHRIDQAIIARCREGFYDYTYPRRHNNDDEAIKIFERAGFVVRAWTTGEGVYSGPAFRIEWGPTHAACG